MSKTIGSASAEIGAPASAVYEIIADYDRAHARILPPDSLRDLRVEAGGHGAGTVISFTSLLGGQQRPMRMEVSEPDPGRVLMEKDPTSGMTTTFTVTPLDGGRRAKVEISTEMNLSPGLKGVVERLMVPGILRRSYAKELVLLAQVAAETGASA